MAKHSKHKMRSEDEMRHATARLNGMRGATMKDLKAMHEGTIKQLRELLESRIDANVKLAEAQSKASDTAIS